MALPLGLRFLYNGNMVKSITVKRKKKRGRPATGTDPLIGVRLPADWIEEIDQLARALERDRSSIIRQLLRQGLDWKKKRKA